MSKSFTRDEVLRLAPDSNSAKSGQDLAQLRKWASLGFDEAALWGECQGSGKKPYQVQVDFSEPAFKCSCPSRKFPCKHGLGLLLLFVSSPDSVPQSARPTWVAEWLATREARAAKAADKETKEAKPRDPVAQEKRREKRIDRAQKGFADLSAWIVDTMRNGIGSLAGKGFEHFDNQARRMVDAQAPGVARMLRQLGSIPSQGAGWEKAFLEQLALIHLLSRAVARYGELPETLRADIESAIGMTTATEDLNSLQGINDHWQIISQEVELEDRLRVQRTWLYGKSSGKSAIILQFAHGASAFETTLIPGTLSEGEIVFFPGGGFRAAVRTLHGNAASLTSLEGCPTIEELLGRYSTALGEFPWLEQLCVPLQQVTPVFRDGSWSIVDRSRSSLPVRIRELDGFTLMSISGGDPVDLAAEFDGKSLRPLSVIAGSQWTSLTSAIAEVA